MIRAYNGACNHKRFRKSLFHWHQLGHEMLHLAQSGAWFTKELCSFHET
jgi:hypothetical protein